MPQPVAPFSKKTHKWLVTFKPHTYNTHTFRWRFAKYFLTAFIGFAPVVVVGTMSHYAGGSMPQAFLDTSAGAFERAFHFNVTTAFVLTKAATPHLLASGAGAV